MVSNKEPLRRFSLVPPGGGTPAISLTPDDGGYLDRNRRPSLQNMGHYNHVSVINSLRLQQTLNNLHTLRGDQANSFQHVKTKTISIKACMKHCTFQGIQAVLDLDKLG